MAMTEQQLRAQIAQEQGNAQKLYELQAQLEAKLAADAKERELAGKSREALKKLLKARVYHDIQSGSPNGAAIRYVLEHEDNPDREAMKYLYGIVTHPVSGVFVGEGGQLRYGGRVYDDPATLEFDLMSLVGREYPKGWLSRLLASPEERALSNALAGPPKIPSDLGLWDKDFYLGLYGGSAF